MRRGRVWGRVGDSFASCSEDAKNRELMAMLSCNGFNWLDYGAGQDFGGDRHV